MTSRADKIRARMERDKASLAGADIADAKEAHKEKLAKAVATKTVLGIVKKIGADVTLTIAHDTGEVTIKGGGGGGDKAQSMSRQAGITDWVVDGELIGSHMGSRLLAALHGIDPQDTKAIRALYKDDSSERVVRNAPTLELAKTHKVKAVIGGKRVDGVKALRESDTR